MLNKMIQKYKVLPKPVKASLWFFMCSFFQKGISTITVPIFTRLLSTAEYGQYNVFNSWLSIVTVFVSLNLYGGVYTQALVKRGDNRAQYVSSMQGLSVILTCVWTIIYLSFRTFINNITSLTTVQMLAMLVMIWTTSIFNFWAVEQRVVLNYKRLVILTGIVSVLKPAIGIIFVILAKDKVTARILGLVLVELICYSALFVAQIKRGRSFISLKDWKYAILLCIPLIPHYLSQVILNSSDRIMIKNMIGESEAGIYSLAYSVSLIMVLANTALLQTLSPWVCEKIKQNRIKDIASISYMVLGIIAISNIFVMAFAPEIIAIFAPADYREAIWTIPPVTMSLLFMFAYNLFSEFEFYFEKSFLISAETIFGAVLNLVLNYIFIPKYGYQAAGYTTLICYILYAVTHYLGMMYVCRSELNNIKPYSLKILLFIMMGYLGFGFMFLLLYKNTIIRYLFIGTMVILLIVFRRKIIDVINLLVQLRKEGRKGND